MRRIATVMFSLLVGWAAAADQTLSKGQYDIFVNGVNRGRERYREEVDKKDGNWFLRSDLYYKLPFKEAKRGYLDLYFYPEYMRDLSSGEFLQFKYTAKVQDYSETDLVEADQSANEVVDQYRHITDFTDEVPTLTEDVMRQRVDFGVNAGGVRVAGKNLRFSHIKVQVQRAKDEPIRGPVAILDPMSVTAFIPLVDLLKGEGPTWPFWFAIPQYMRYRPGRVEYVGVAESPLNGQSYFLKQYDVMVETGHYASLWVDKANRLVRLSVPKDGFQAVIHGYTPQGFEKAEPRVATQVISPMGSFRESRVTVPSGDVALGATLTLPNGEGPFPAALLIQDLGQSDRDGNLPGASNAGPVRQMAFILAERGVATLRFDSRGRGESGGSAEESTPEQVVGDIAALTGWLRSNPAVKPGQTFALAVGLGGWLALEAQPAAKLTGLVLVAYPGKPVLRLLKEQTFALEDPVAIQRDSRDLEILQAELGSGKTWVEFRGARTFMPALRQLVRVDPLSLLQGQSVPILLAYPEKDVMVQPYHREIVAKVLPAGAEAMVLPKVDHSLVQPDPERGVTGVVDRAAVNALADWIVARGSSKP